VDTALSVGRYGIDEWLASGAMGVVFRGYDPDLDRPVAIKILRRELAKGNAAEEWRDRFKRRARAAARLFHPNIPTILDFAEDHEVPFIALEYIDGARLDRLLKTAGRFSAERAIAVILQVLGALEHAHENGVVHLDIKPSILLLDANDQVKVADFGAALANADEPVTNGELSERFSCVAPEQLTRSSVDRRTDIFAAAAVLFEMLTGEKPFRGASTDEIIAQMTSQGPEGVCALNSDVPHALRSIIDTALAYDPARRFPTADEFSRALSDAISPRNGPEAVPQSAIGSPVLEAGWDPETLREVEADLAMHVGPVAALAVRRATRRANDLAALYEALAVHIENRRERDEFLKGGLRRAAAPSDERAFSEPQVGPKDPVPDSNEPSWPPDPAMTDAIEARLAEHIGPIARVLVKQQLQNCQSLPELYRGLADHIADEAERAAFLNSGGI
jgi:eukaryotic-like serine/threonine-protein kinase